jgi:hypothetical protein
VKTTFCRWTAGLGTLLGALAPVLGVGTGILCGLYGVPAPLAIGAGAAVGSVALWEGLGRCTG